jgi:drug/metabolite transporter (DMT)-like permease
MGYKLSERFVEPKKMPDINPEQPHRFFVPMTGPEAGIMIMIATTAVFAASDSLVKTIGTAVPLLVLLLVRYLFQATALGIWRFKKGGFAAFRTGSLKMQVIRALLLLTNSACTFEGLRNLPLPVTTSVAMMAPLIATLLAVTLLRDTVSRGRWAMVILGFIGMLLVVRPGGSGFSWSILFPIGAATTFAFFQVLSSRMSRTGSDAMTTNFLTGLIGTLVLSVLVWADQAEIAPQLRGISVRSWLTAISMASVATLGQLLMLQALGRAPLSILTPFSYGQLAFASFFSWMLFGQTPDAWMIAGMLVIAASGIGTVWIHNARLPS